MKSEARMYKVIEYKANGEQIDSITEVAAFYGLSVDGVLVEYYTTFEALEAAIECEA
jgi:hypothetical protein